MSGVFLSEFCECEQSSQSEWSPGLVGDNEAIARLVFSPLHVDENGNVLSTAFSDIDSRGLSVNRLTYCPLHVLISLGRKKEAMDRDRGRHNRTFLGFVEAPVSNVRYVKRPESDDRAFCVLDTALSDNASHADVIFEDVSQLSKGQRKKLRRILQYEVFEQKLKKI